MAVKDYCTPLSEQVAELERALRREGERNRGLVASRDETEVARAAAWAKAARLEGELAEANTHITHLADALSGATNLARASYRDLKMCHTCRHLRRQTGGNMCLVRKEYGRLSCVCDCWEVADGDH